MNKYEPSPEVRKEMDKAYQRRMAEHAKARKLAKEADRHYLRLVRDPPPLYLLPGGNPADCCPRCGDVLGNDARLGKSRNGGRWLLWHFKCVPTKKHQPTPPTVTRPPAARGYVAPLFPYEPERGRSLLDAIDRYKRRQR